MKKILIAGLFSAGAAFTANAQYLKPSEVPAAVKKSFHASHSGNAVKWEKENGKYEAGFKRNGMDVSILYKADGTLIETETDIKILSLPAAVLSYMKSHYAGQKIKEAAKTIAADGTVTYEAEIEEIDVIFDGAGKFLKELKESKDVKSEKD